MIIVDKEFESLIPPLTEEEFKQLEENILRDGIRDPLCVWRPSGRTDEPVILIDGHNRFKISAQHGGIPFQIKEVMLADREVAKQWIIRKQLGQRNLNTIQKIELAEVLRKSIEKQAKERMLSGKKDPTQTFAQGETNKQIGDIAGVSKETVRKYRHVIDKGSEETKAKVKSGEFSINQGYKQTVKENEPPKPDIPTVEEEHEAFLEKKRTAPIVTMDEIEIDKNNQRIIAIDTITAIEKAAEKMENFMFDKRTNSLAKIKERIGALTNDERQDMIRRMRNIRNFASGIIKLMEGD